MYCIFIFFSTETC